MLMSCSLSQKMAPETPMYHRLLVGYGVTDEIFGISVNVPGRLDPFYVYGAVSIASPAWALGTLFGVVLGNVLPSRIRWRSAWRCTHVHRHHRASGPARTACSACSFSRPWP